MREVIGYEAGDSILCPGERLLKCSLFQWMIVFTWCRGLEIQQVCCINRESSSLSNSLPHSLYLYLSFLNVLTAGVDPDDEKSIIYTWGARGSFLLFEGSLTTLYMQDKNLYISLSLSSKLTKRWGPLSFCWSWSWSCIELF
jgi:hypothetical protein